MKVTETAPVSSGRPQKSTEPATKAQAAMDQLDQLSSKNANVYVPDLFAESASVCHQRPELKFEFLPSVDDLIQTSLAQKADASYQLKKPANDRQVVSVANAQKLMKYWAKKGHSNWVDQRRALDESADNLYEYCHRLWHLIEEFENYDLTRYVSTIESDPIKQKELVSLGLKSGNIERTNLITILIEWLEMLLFMMGMRADMPPNYLKYYRQILKKELESGGKRPAPEGSRPPSPKKMKVTTVKATTTSASADKSVPPAQAPAPAPAPGAIPAAAAGPVPGPVPASGATQEPPDYYTKVVKLYLIENDNPVHIQFDKVICQFYKVCKNKIDAYPKTPVFKFLPTYDELFRSVFDPNLFLDKMVVHHQDQDRAAARWNASHPDWVTQVQALTKEEDNAQAYCLAYIGQLIRLMMAIKRDAYFIHREREQHWKVQQMAANAQQFRDPALAVDFLVMEFHAIGQIAMELNLYRQTLKPDWEVKVWGEIQTIVREMNGIAKEFNFGKVYKRVPDAKFNFLLTVEIMEDLIAAKATKNTEALKKFEKKFVNQIVSPDNQRNLADKWRSLGREGWVQQLDQLDRSKRRSGDTIFEYIIRLHTLDAEFWKRNEFDVHLKPKVEALETDPIVLERILRNDLPILKYAQVKELCQAWLGWLKVLAEMTASKQKSAADSHPNTTSPSAKRTRDDTTDVGPTDSSSGRPQKSPKSEDTSPKQKVSIKKAPEGYYRHAVVADLLIADDIHVQFDQEIVEWYKGKRGTISKTYHELLQQSKEQFDFLPSYRSDDNCILRSAFDNQFSVKHKKIIACGDPQNAKTLAKWQKSQPDWYGQLKRLMEHKTEAGQRTAKIYIGRLASLMNALQIDAHKIYENHRKRKADPKEETHWLIEELDAKGWRNKEMDIELAIATLIDDFNNIGRIARDWYQECRWD